MRIYNLKKASIPKVVVLATGLVAALLVGTLGPPAAQAFPTRARDCTQCHGSGAVSGTVSAVPSTTTPTAGGAYTVLVTPPTGSGDTGYWIANSTSAGTTGTSVVSGGGTGTSAPTYTASMTAPASAGTYYYKVWAVKGMPDPSAARIALAGSRSPPGKPSETTRSIVTAEWLEREPTSTAFTIDGRFGRGSNSQICDFIANAWLRSCMIDEPSP